MAASPEPQPPPQAEEEAAGAVDRCCFISPSIRAYDLSEATAAVCLTRFQTRNLNGLQEVTCATAADACGRLIASHADGVPAVLVLARRRRAAAEEEAVNELTLLNGLRARGVLALRVSAQEHGSHGGDLDIVSVMLASEEVS